MGVTYSSFSDIIIYKGGSAYAIGRTKQKAGKNRRYHNGIK